MDAGVVIKKEKKKKWLDVADMGFFTDKNVVAVRLFTKKKKVPVDVGLFTGRTVISASFFTERSLVNTGFSQKEV